MTAKADLAMGQVVFTDKPQILPLDCPVAGVTACQTSRKWSRHTVEERMYECANGWAIFLRRGGPLHLADKATWELILMRPIDGGPAPVRVKHGEPIGWVDEATALRAVRNLAVWFERGTVVDGSRCAS